MKYYNEFRKKTKKQQLKWLRPFCEKLWMPEHNETISLKAAKKKKQRQSKKTSTLRAQCTHPETKTKKTKNSLLQNMH